VPATNSHFHVVFILPQNSLEAKEMWFVAF
jgi:hypothetical protein